VRLLSVTGLSRLKAARVVVGFCRPPQQIALAVRIGGTARESAKASGAIS